MHLLRAVAAFWYDFLVGDRPELFVGPIAALALGWLLVRAGVAPVVAGGTLVLSIVVVGGISLYVTARPRS